MWTRRPKPIRYIYTMTISLEFPHNAPAQDAGARIPVDVLVLYHLGGRSLRRHVGWVCNVCELALES